MCLSQANPATGKVQIVRDAVLDARGEVASTPAPCEETVHVQLSADSAVVSVCAEKVREAERKFELERARADTAEARVKDLEIRLKDQGEKLARLKTLEMGPKDSDTNGRGAIHSDPGMGSIH